MCRYSGSFTLLNGALVRAVARGLGAKVCGAAGLWLQSGTMTKSALNLGLLLLFASGPACDGGDDGDKTPCATPRCGSGVDAGGAGDGDGDGTQGDGDSGGGNSGDGDACACGDDDASVVGDGSAGDGDGSVGDGDSSTGDGDAGGDGDVDPPACSTASAPDVTGLTVSTVVSGLSDLVYAAQPKGSKDWYLVQQNGVIRVLRDGQASPNTTAFLTIANGATNGNGGDERGLLSLAFPADYATSGLFYVMMTPVDGDKKEHDLVLRYSRSAGDAYVADPNSRFVITDVPESASNHNGGTITFGPDGLLYVGVGDGGGGCNNNKPDMPQDIDSLYGKILRLDLSKPGPDYAAVGNPFANGGDARVLHYGVRNPFRFGLDRITGDLYVPDVGQDAYEEINFATSGAKGLNFGWAKFEGVSATCGGRELRDGTTQTAPTLVIDRRAIGCTGSFCDYRSVVGGPVYRGTAIPKLSGVYLFGDYIGGRLGAFTQCGNQRSPVSVLRKRCNGSEEACIPQNDGFGALAAIVEGSDGEIYFVTDRSKLVKLVKAAP
jgi:glucose/arabinose dehydrogenase